MSLIGASRRESEKGVGIGSDRVEWEMKNGTHFYIFNTATLGSGDELWMKLVVPANKHIRLRWNIGSTGAVDTKFYKDADGFGTGTAKTIYNSKVSSSSPNSGCTMEAHTSAPSTLGTQIDGAIWGTRRVGGSQDKDEGLILTEGTYCRYIKSGDNSNRITMKAYWSEHNNE